MKKILIGLTTLVAVMTLSACSNNKDTKDSNKEKAKTEKVAKKSTSKKDSKKKADQKKTTTTDTDKKEEIAQKLPAQNKEVPAKDTKNVAPVKESEIVNQYYVGVSEQNKNRYFSFMTGNDKATNFREVNKDGSQDIISYYYVHDVDDSGKKIIRTITFQADKSNNKVFHIIGWRAVKKPEFDGSYWKFTKVGPDTIRDVQGNDWKLYTGKKDHKSIVEFVQKNAGMPVNTEKLDTVTHMDV